MLEFCTLIKKNLYIFRTLLAFYNGYRIPTDGEYKSNLYALDQVWNLCAMDRKKRTR
jgi:hypothetical protein